ncbi:ARM repeat-containing protein [Ramicandelaber brevisporus]|nr:ARM repeat-containing protein [Ramicandelaber brevisporus]
MSFSQTLLETLHNDANIRVAATAKLEQYSNADLAGCCLDLSRVLSSEQEVIDARLVAGVALKNTFSSNVESQQKKQVTKWTSIPEPTRTSIKQNLLATLGSPVVKAGNTAASAVSAIARIELPQKHWTELIGGLVSNMDAADNAGLRLNTISTLGYITHDISPEVLAPYSDQVLTTVVRGAHSSEPTVEVRRAALNALSNSIPFISSNFSRDQERNYIMQVVCEATQLPDTETQVLAYQVLVSIVEHYYSYMSLYMERALNGLMLGALTSTEENVAKQGLEFWTTVCEVEQDLIAENMEAEYEGRPAPNTVHGFARSMLKELCEVLVVRLTEQDEDDDEDDFTTAMAAATCLASLAQVTANAIVPFVISFIEGNIRHQKWQNREAAVMAFGSILEGPETNVLLPFVNQALPVLVELMKDPSTQVKDTAAWTLGRVCKFVPEAIKPDSTLEPVLHVLVTGLADEHRVGISCCLSIIHLTIQVSEGTSQDLDTFPMSQYYEPILSALVQVTERSAVNAHFRRSAYEAMKQLVEYAAADCMPVISKLAAATLDRMTGTITHLSKISSVEEGQNMADNLSSLCNLLSTITRRAGKEIAPIADRVMELLLGMMNSLNSVDRSSAVGIAEDALLTIGSVATALDTQFARYIEHLTPFLVSGLERTEENHLYSIAVGVTSDVYRACGTHVPEATSDSLMNLLVQAMGQSAHTSMLNKSATLSTVGDIAQSIGPAFEKYLQPILELLQQASNACFGVDPDNVDSYDEIMTLRGDVLSAYIGIIQGFKPVDVGGQPGAGGVGAVSNVAAQLIIAHFESIFSLLQRLAVEDDVQPFIQRSIVGLLGDIAELFKLGGGAGPQYVAAFQQAWVTSFIKKARANHGDPELRDTALWARKAIKSL